MNQILKIIILLSIVFITACGGAGNLRGTGGCEECQTNFATCNKATIGPFGLVDIVTLNESNDDYNSCIKTYNCTELLKIN